MIDPTRTCGTCALYSEAARPGENKTPRGATTASEELFS